MSFFEERARLSTRGQLVIPKAIRQAMQLESGDELTVVYDGEAIFIAPRQAEEAVQQGVEEVRPSYHAQPPAKHGELQPPGSPTARERVLREKAKQQFARVCEQWHALDQAAFLDLLRRAKGDAS